MGSEVVEVAIASAVAIERALRGVYERRGRAGPRSDEGLKKGNSGYPERS